MSNPKVAIVIVNWNKKDFILNLLKSLEELNYDNYEIIVVDNASTDGSAEAIREAFPYVTLIINKENLGGTGGFNTGMRYAIENKDCKYIWLLDNDTEIENESLIKLVKVMEDDRRIGIAGSMILNPEMRNLIVGLGAFVSWKVGAWIPYLRNQRLSDFQKIDTVEVDYVAACSVLVKKEAVLKVGLMDERYFLHWDDIDFSLRIKESGYKVVAVSSSKVYHGVEKGFNPFLVYYDIRNGLLTMSKHIKGFNRFFYMLNMTRGSFKKAIFSYLTGQYSIGNLILVALLDFIRGNFYKIKSDSPINILIKKRDSGLFSNEIFLSEELKILIFPNGSFSEIKKLVNMIKSSYNCTLSLLIQSDRKELFKDLPIDNYIVFESYDQSSFRTIPILLKIFSSKYDIAISPNLTLIPFFYAVKKCYLFATETNKFYKSKEDLYSFWKLILAFLAGEALSFCFLPIIYLSSFREKNSWSSNFTSLGLKQNTKQ